MENEVKEIFWKDGTNGECEGGLYFRAFDLVKFIEKVEADNKKVVGIRVDGNNLELITQNNGKK